MTQYWAKMHMKSDSAAESVRPAKSQGPAGAYWESLVKLPFGGAFARQRPILSPIGQLLPVKGALRYGISFLIHKSC